jgi:hypothetical protein
MKEFPQIEQTKRGLEKARRAQHNPTISRILNF